MFKVKKPRMFHQIRSSKECTFMRSLGYISLKKYVVSMGCIVLTLAYRHMDLEDIDVSSNDLGYHGSMVKRKQTEGRNKMDTNIYEQGIM